MGSIVFMLLYCSIRAVYFRMGRMNSTRVVVPVQWLLGSRANTAACRHGLIRCETQQVYAACKVGMLARHPKSDGVNQLEATVAQTVQAKLTALYRNLPILPFS